MQISEYVSLGHPDKVADYISEYILDRLIEQDKHTRYALEVQIKDNFVSLAGEITTNAKTNYKKWVRDAIASIGYTHEYAKVWGKGNTLDASKVKVETHISKQSNDIAQGVNNNGWGDQGIFFGCAYNCPEIGYMPSDYYLAKMIGMGLYEDALTDENHFMGLDIKTQVVMDMELAKPIKKIIVAVPLLVDYTPAIISKIKDCVGGLMEKHCQIIINGTGTFIKHASMGDCGTTGRKLAVDFYGGNCNVGGGSPWTKDGTKADLTLNMYARKKALDYVKNFRKEYVKCGIGCCIGRPEIEVSFWDSKNKLLESHTEKTPPDKLIKAFGLDKPIYADLCKNGLFEDIE